MHHHGSITTLFGGRATIGNENAVMRQFLMDSISQAHTQPDVLSRGALEMTFQLLRQNNASLALDIQEQLLAFRINDPEQRSQETRSRQKNTECDHYRITLNPQTVGLIVDALTKLGERYLRNDDVTAEEIGLIRGLIGEWADLAEWLISKAQPINNTLH